MFVGNIREPASVKRLPMPMSSEGMSSQNILGPWRDASFVFFLFRPVKAQQKIRMVRFLGFPVAAVKSYCASFHFTSFQTGRTVTYKFFGMYLNMQ